MKQQRVLPKRLAPHSCHHPHLVLAGALLPRLQPLQGVPQLLPQLGRLALRRCRRRRIGRAGRRRRRWRYERRSRCCRRGRVHASRQAGAGCTLRLQHGHPRPQHLLLLVQVSCLALLARQRAAQLPHLPLQLRLQPLPGGHALRHPPRRLALPPLQVGGCRLGRSLALPQGCRLRLQRRCRLGGQPAEGLQLLSQLLQRRLAPAQGLLQARQACVPLRHRLLQLLLHRLAELLQWQSWWGRAMVHGG